MELQKGQKCKLADLTGSGQLRISVTVSLPGSEADVTCFGVDGRQSFRPWLSAMRTATTRVSPGCSGTGSSGPMGTCICT